MYVNVAHCHMTFTSHQVDLLLCEVLDLQTNSWMSGRTKTQHPEMVMLLMVMFTNLNPITHDS